MSQDGSFVGAFNLSTQAGVAAVLAAIRASQLSSSDKNALRDLVFSYTNGGGDASVRIALEQKLAAHAIVPVVPQRGGGAAPVLPFGTYRPTPNFKAPSAVSAVSPTMSSQAVPSVAPAAQPQPVVQPAPVVTPPTPPQPQPVPTPIAQAVVETGQSIPSIPPVIPVQPAPAPVAQVVTSPAENIPSEAVYLERIRQIKTAVNSKVGNPVNLVDINNVVGREYMNALLEAMKKLGSGAISEVAPAMQRLETAFVAVQEAIKQHEEKSHGAPIAPVETPVAPVLNSQPPVVPVVQPEATAPLPVRNIVSPAQSAPVTPAPEPFFETPVNTAQVSVVQSVPTDRVPVMDVPLPPRPSEPVSAAPIPQSGFEVQVPSPLPPIPKAPPSLAQEPKLRTPQDLPDPASVETGEKGDPLFTKEVDEGLDQLLSDWSLFKKSGLFGTGPKGKEHPLFKKISGLQVPLLLAGRFEGANQEIRQSITDYMNGWRYEQGIIYQPGETFERYLRRVIRHILDLQKKRRAA